MLKLDNFYLSCPFFLKVCPGDLLVYSKALTHRGNFAGEKKGPYEDLLYSLQCCINVDNTKMSFFPTDLDGSTQSLANDAGKNIRNPIRVLIFIN